MTQAFSTCLGLVLNLATFAGTTQWMMSIGKQNAIKITTLWHAEYDAHVCGRALSAVANIHGAATLASHMHPSKKKIIAAAELYFRRKLFAKYENEFQMTSSQCFNLNSHELIAEVYLRNSDAANVNDPNYGYRLVGAKQ